MPKKRKSKKHAKQSKTHQVDAKKNQQSQIRETTA